MGIDAIVGLVSLFGPKLISLVGGMFGKKNSPEQTLASLAQSNPDALGKYIEAQATLLKAQNEAVNADVSGAISVWVSNVRALIRPALSVLAAVHLVYAYAHGTVLDEGTRYTYEAMLCSWFGSRLAR
jgi:hypothetical protein